MRVGVVGYLMSGSGGYRAAGVSTYIYQLLRHLPAVSPRNEYVAFVGRDGPRVAGVTEVVAVGPTRRAPVRIVWEQMVVPAQALGMRLDLIHGTVNVAPILNVFPAVVTVHDLSFMRLPERFHASKVRYLRTAVGMSVRRARRVIAVSNRTRRDLIELLHVPPDRIDVVHSGKDASFTVLPESDLVSVRSHFGGRPFILYVGTLEPRKNIDILLRSFAAARARGNYPHALALVGAPGWMYDNLFGLSRTLGIEEHVDFVGYVPPDQLPRWYNAADLFVYPSAYEGFGLPVLEAMACGVPTITTFGSGVEELAGEACLTVEANSVDALEAAITTVLGDATLRQRLNEAGLERARGFSWELTAAATAEVYLRALEGP